MSYRFFVEIQSLTHSDAEKQKKSVITVHFGFHCTLKELCAEDITVHMQ